MKPDVTVVIPNYNGAKLLRDNLPTVLEAAAAYGEDTAIIVVDDGSTDDSVTVLKQAFPQIRLVEHSRNMGFSEAVYSGISAANTELILLLNSDVRPDNNVIQALTGYFKAPDTFAVGPLIRNEHGEINRHSWNVREFRQGNLNPIEWSLEAALTRRKQHWLPAAYVSGGSVLLRKSMFMALGGFHSMYKPFYGEDYDLGLRAWRLGWRSYFEPGVCVTHQREGSSIKSNTRRAYVKQIRRRNRLLLEWTHFPAGRLCCSVLPRTIWKLLGELLTLDKVNVAGFFSALARVPVVLRERRKLIATQTLSLDEVLEQIAKNP